METVATPQAVSRSTDSIRVCIPSWYSPDDARQHAAKEYPVLTMRGWEIRSLVRVPCDCVPGRCHVSLEAPV